MNKDKSKPYWTVAKVNGAILIRDINGVSDDEYMPHDYEEEVWAQNACDHRNWVNGQIEHG